MDASGDLEAVRSYIRSICVQDQARWEVSWKAALANRDSARGGLVRPDVFVQTLEANSVFFPRPTARALVERFRAPSGGVRAARFLAWVELSRPADHVDPELTFARLPQPFRRIRKVLERDILDASWERITQQSARFRAEAAAALAVTARSQPGRADAAVADQDGDDDAKKRCCKRFERVDLGDSSRVVAGVAQHDALPVLVVALDAASAHQEHAHAGVVLRVVSALTHESIATHTLPCTESSPPADGVCTQLRVSGLTPVRVRRPVAQGGGDAATLAVGVLLTESTTTPASGEQPEKITRVTLVRVFDFVGVDTRALSRPGAGGDTGVRFRLTAAGAFEHLEWLELSPDGHLVALSTAPGRVSVFTVPSSSSSSSTDEPAGVDSTEAAIADLNSAATVVAIDYEGAPTTLRSLSKAHFLLQPLTQAWGPQLGAPKAYALIVCHGTQVFKFLLSAGSGGGGGTARAMPVLSWSHLAAITSSALDATTQFLVVGLADGALVVWDTLEETHRAYLPAATTPAAAGADALGGCTGRDGSVDTVVMHRSEFVVAFSSAAQQIRFFDIRQRGATPMLRRVVGAPLPTGSQPGDSVRMLSIVETTRVLDIPVAIVAYSNGTHVLFDIRSGVAIGNVRSRSATVLASPHGVVVATAVESSVLDFYDWRELLLASFPSLERMLHAQDSSTAKRVFLSTGAALAQLAPERPSADAIEKLLRRTAGVVSTMSSGAGMSNQRQSEKSGLGLVASDSSASVGPPCPLSMSDTDDAPTLPPLPEVALGPSVCSVRERFGEYARDLAAAASKEKEARMHRRRKELIKALTAGAW
ncbi:hypothetical protein PybrP1_001482 [[Pythium] brassicae (nom. inval.)]|nr:hypothetical protein PybrP1_001482 [[Pythium] brassicae (nom. inval.)]